MAAKEARNYGIGAGRSQHLTPQHVEAWPKLDTALIHLPCGRHQSLVPGVSIAFGTADMYERGAVGSSYRLMMNRIAEVRRYELGF